MHPLVTSFFMEDYMNIYKLCLIIFCLLIIVFYFYNLFKASQMLKNKKNRKNKDKYIFSVKYLMNKFKLKKEKLLTKKMLFIYSIIDSFIITLVFMIISLIEVPFIVQLFIGFALLFALIYAIYELLGRYLKKKEGSYE